MEAVSKLEAQPEEEHFPNLPNVPQSDLMSPARTRRINRSFRQEHITAT